MNRRQPDSDSVLISALIGPDMELFLFFFAHFCSKLRILTTMSEDRAVP